VELGTEKIPRLNVLNKVDLISDPNMIERRKRELPQSVIISASEKIRLNELKSKIFDKMEENFQTIDIEFPYDNGKFIALAQDGVEVLKREYEEDSVKLKIRGSRSRINQILNIIQ